MKKTSLKLNFIYQIIYQMLLIVLPLITSPYLSRIIGPGGMGAYSYSYSIVYYFSLFILLGVNNHGTRSIAQVKDNLIKRSEVFWGIYSIQLIMGIFLFVIYFTTQVYLPKDDLLAKIQAIYLLSAILDINWFFFGLERFKITVTRNMIIKVLTVIMMFLFVKKESDVDVYTFIMSTGALVSQVSLWPFLLKEIKMVSITKELVIKNIKPMFVLFVPVVATSIYKYMDKIMLGYLCDKAELGFYDNSEKIMAIPLGLITALGTVMLPRISNMVSNKKNEMIMKYIDLSMEFSMFAANALAFGLAAVSEEFAPWFWGSEFQRSAILTKYISITVIFISWANVIRTQYLIPNKKDSVFVKASIIGAIGNFTVNSILIPRNGALGAVIGTIIAEFFVAIYQTVKCKNELPVLKYLRCGLPYMFFGMIMYSSVRGISVINASIGLRLCVELFVGVVVYLSLSLTYILCNKKVKIGEVLYLQK